MYDKVMTLIAACLYSSGWVALGRWWMQRQGPQLMILNYHTATEGDLRQHLLYLSTCGIIIVSSISRMLRRSSSQLTLLPAMPGWNRRLLSLSGTSSL